MMVFFFVIGKHLMVDFSFNLWEEDILIFYIQRYSIRLYIEPLSIPVGEIYK